MTPTSIKSTKKDDKKVAKKDDHCVDLKLIKKGQPIAALFVCVFLDTTKKVAHCYSVFYIEIFDFDNFDMIL